MLKSLFWSFPALLLAGCVFSPYRETAYFDLSPEKVKLQPGMVLSVEDLQNRSGAGTRFRYHAENGQVLADPDHKWILPPGSLVSKGLRTAFTPDLKDKKNADSLFSTDKIRKLRGELLTFEYDMPSRTFRMQTRITVMTQGGEREVLDFVSRIPVEDKSAESVVRAANQAVHDLAVRISRMR